MTLKNWGISPKPFVCAVPQSTVCWVVGPDGPERIVPMSLKPDYETQRLHALARRNGMERSLYLGEAIGETLLIATHGLEACVTMLRRMLHLRPARHG